MSPLDILYQDEHLVAIDKPAGYLVHPAEHPKSGDRVAMKILRDQLGQTVEVIHRLDQPTSGIVLFALDRRTAKRLRQDFEKRRLTKTYLAVVHGHPTATHWTCERPLRKDDHAPEKSALTQFRLIETLGPDFSLLEVTPHTGRLHQIRRHLLASQHPIVGDFRYLNENDCHATGARLGIGTRMLLQAHTLSLTHPRTGAPLVLVCPPDPLITRLQKKKALSQGRSGL